MSVFVSMAFVCCLCLTLRPWSWHCFHFGVCCLPLKVNDDLVILDKTVGDQVSIWKSSRGFSDEAVVDHLCSGNTCSYSQIGDVFLCDKTGCVHGKNGIPNLDGWINPIFMLLIYFSLSAVCDDACREIVLDQASGLLVCTISGHCFDRWLSPEEESSTSDGVMIT